MSKKIFENIKENLKPSKSLIDNTKAKIIENDTCIKIHISYKKAMTIVASLILIFAVCIPTLLHNTKFLKPKEPSDAKNSSFNNASELKGVVVVAYSPKIPGQTISANYIEETLPIEMKSNISVLLPSYSPAMSSVPGFPFQFKAVMTDGTSKSDYNMEISVDNCSLIYWDIKSGEIIDNGKLYRGKSETTLYWSPLVNEELAQTAQICVTIYKNQNQICSQTIYIEEEEYAYKASIQQ